MPPRPNFTGVARKDGNIVLSGQSDDFEDIVGIRVILSQTDKAEGGVMEAADVLKPGSPWRVVIPAGSFTPGPAVAFGVETRKANFTTITWAEEVTIP